MGTKEGGNPKDLEFSNNVPKRLDEKVSKLITKYDKNHQNALNIVNKYDEKRNMIIDNSLDSSIDMLTIFIMDHY